MTKPNTARKSRFMPEQQKREVMIQMLTQISGVKSVLDSVGDEAAKIVGGSSGNVPSSVYLREIGHHRDPNSINCRAYTQLEKIEEKLHAALGALGSSRV